MRTPVIRLSESARRALQETADVGLNHMDR